MLLNLPERQKSDPKANPNARTPERQKIKSQLVPHIKAPLSSPASVVFDVERTRNANVGEFSVAAPDVVRAFRGVRLPGGKKLLHESVQTVAEALSALGVRHRGSFDGLGENFK